MNLIIDIGNTRTKIAVFHQGEPEQVFSYHSNEINWAEVGAIEFDKCIISSVGAVKMDIPKDILDNAIMMDHATPLPIELRYETPETLGMDRICNAVAANVIKPSGNNLAIDMGSCITYDVVDGHGVYHGGAISPGLSMRIKSLNNYTHRLPVINPTYPSPVTGTSTETSINSGVVNGMINEINGMIEQYSNEFDDLQVFITGGDADFFADAIKNSIFADNFLTLRGLNQILEYN